MIMRGGRGAESGRFCLGAAGDAMLPARLRDSHGPVAGRPEPPGEPGAVETSRGGSYDRARKPRRAPTMLVNCVAYEEGRKIADIPKEDISEYVKKPNAFVWVALKDPDPAELDDMAQEFGLHELAVDDARQGHQRPKIEEYGDSLFAVLHNTEVVRTNGDSELKIGEVD